MDMQVNRLLYNLSLVLFVTGIILCGPVCAVHVMVFEQSDRTAPVPHALIYSDGMYRAITDENGTYNLTYEGEPPKLRIIKAGYREWAGTPLPNDSLLLVPLQVRNCTYSVQIFDADTLLPIEGALVKIKLENTLFQEEYSSTNGTVILSLRAEQVYDLTISSRNYQVVKEKLITRFEDGDVQYSLIRTDRISLLVKDSRDGRFISDVVIKINGTPSGKSNEKGILITNLTRGENYILEAIVTGYEKALVQVTPDIDDQILEIPLIRLKSPAFISVYDPNQEPVEGADILIDGNDIGHTNKYGRLTVPDLMVREYIVTVSKEGYESLSRSLTFYPTEPDIILDIKPEPVTVSFLVADPGGNPIFNASVLINEIDGNTTDVNGITDFSLIQGRTYMVSASAKGYDSNNSTITLPVSSPVIFSLQQNKQEGTDTPLTLIIISSTIIGGIVIGILYFGFIRKKQSRSQKKRISLRKRSL